MMINTYKAIIVDDEENTRELIKMCVDWHKVGFKIIGEANNAEEALGLIENEKPDLVLTDICMPYMNGIKLSEKLYKEYPEIKIVIITGHNNFEYAQRGIKAGVCDFIIKPIDEDEIESTLSKIYGDIKNERELKDSYKLLEEQLKKEKPFLREKFLIDLLNSYIEEQDYNIRKKFIGIQFATSQFQVINIEIAGKNIENIFHEQDVYLSYMFLDYIKKIINNMLGVEIYIDSRNNIILLNNNPYNESEMINKLEIVVDGISGHSDISIVIGIGSWCNGFNNIKISYKEAKEAAAHKIISGLDQIITYDDLIIKKADNEINYGQWKDKLSLYIKGGISKDAKEITEQVFNELKFKNKINLKFIQLQAIEIIMVVINATSEIGLNIEEKLEMENIFEKTFKLHSLPEINLEISLYVEKICKNINKEHSKKQKTIIDKINQYVNENIKNQISLNTISEKFHLNKSYLSRIYKESTGITLGEYILNQRMELSIMLIVNTDKKAYEIANEVGYIDPNYFGSSFKKYTGKSISEFRKSIIS